ncbi:MAG: hypothetical protein C6W55_10500 [Thermobacillus sp.]|uniref:helix-turn-helix domain-containing protein n=1 Tax=Thermobacillus sp. TaxID=2108467 RepID=UPI000E37C8AB|nr:helix-turn-helix domain-containing protein [Thermobacillus sp.]REK54751.1 MAG: hypothetical protein C6W55_10500 [Thermobacillus sp.]
MNQATMSAEAAIVEALKQFVETILPAMVSAEIKQQQTVQRATLTVEEAAIYLGVHPDTVRKLIRERVIPVSRLAGRIVLRASTLDKVLDQLELESIRSDSVA